MKNKKLTITLSMEKLVPVTEDHGGYKAGKCLLCGTPGWLVENRFGRPHNAKNIGADLQHKKNCPVNKELVNSAKEKK